MARRKNKTSLLDRVLGGKVEQSQLYELLMVLFYCSREASGPTTGASRTALSARTDILVFLVFKVAEDFRILCT